METVLAEEGARGDDFVLQLATEVDPVNLAGFVGADS